MLKELVATVLLSTCVGANNLKPKQASNLNQLLGAYCYRQEPLYDNFDEDLEVEITGTFFVYNANGYTFDESGYIDILYDDDDSEIDVNISNASTQQIYNSNFEWNDTLDVFSSIQTKNMVVYFVEPIYLSADQMNNFQCFFTPFGNSYVSFYTGWYTFNRNVNYTDYFSLMGNLSVNNYLVNQLVFDDSNNVIYGVNVGGLGNEKYNIHESSNWVGSQLVYLNSLIPSNLQAKMLNHGVFNYVPSTYDATFYDLLFGLADIPVKILVDMFSFNLLGVELSVAILSMMTFALMCIVFKFIIKFF